MLKPILAITMGDPAGVGPEIIVKALADPVIHDICRPFVVGDRKILERACEVTLLPLPIHEIEGPEEGCYTPGVIDLVALDLVSGDLPFGKVSAVAGDAAFQFLKKAVDLALEGRLQAIVTAPLNKEALHKGGHPYPGHTEILADLTGTKDYAMMLSAPHLKVIHLTTHMGLIDAIESLTPERTYKVIRLAHEVLMRSGCPRPRVAVAAINPHAGENGLFGRGEEAEKLVPAIERARSEGVEVSGPYPADTVFNRALRGDFDIVVACYHDQGHVPVKVLGFDDGVNITVGLKGGVIRTSVDHGTAFDIAGKNLASPQSLIAAIRDAAELAPKE